MMVYVTIYNILDSIKYDRGNYCKRPAFPRGQLRSAWGGSVDFSKLLAVRESHRRPVRVLCEKVLSRNMALPF